MQSRDKTVTDEHDEFNQVTMMKYLDMACGTKLLLSTSEGNTIE